MGERSFVSFESQPFSSNHHNVGNDHLSIISNSTSKHRRSASFSSSILVAAIHNQNGLPSYSTADDHFIKETYGTRHYDDAKYEDQAATEDQRIAAYLRNDSTMRQEETKLRPDNDIINRSISTSRCGDITDTVNRKGTTP